MLGAHYSGSDKCRFRVWTPNVQNISTIITTQGNREIPLVLQENGYWQAQAENVQPGSRYFFRLNNSTERSDPASNYQPEGVFGPSEVIDHESFEWTDDNWHGIPLSSMIMYEIHTGTFTPEGTFEAITSRLDDLIELGVNAIELMPVTQFPGERNWGYDGVFPFAVQNSYGGPEKLKYLVNICHQKNIAVILDVVYNHLGPEGNFLPEFGPYFTEKYETPWGKAINFDDEHSDQVRHYFISNAIYWFELYHIDALRLDALHAVFDMSAKHFVRELAEKVADFSSSKGRKFYLIGESDLNDVRLIKPMEKDGYGLDAQWCDDFHHSLHALLTHEEGGYYDDFGQINHLVKAFREGFVYSWQYSKYRKRKHGSSSRDVPAGKFVVFSQNHDQVGNRMTGERLPELVSFEKLKLAAGIVLFSPYIPMLFMGQEYGEDAPFLYFVSHNDPSLVSAVREGRKSQFDTSESQARIPDPQAIETFLDSKIKWEDRNCDRHKILLEFYTELIRMRKEIPALYTLNNKNLQIHVIAKKRLLILHRRHYKSHVICFVNFEHEECNFTPDMPEGIWSRLIDSSEEKWAGKSTTLPVVIEKTESMTIGARSFATYQLTSSSEVVNK